MLSLAATTTGRVIFVCAGRTNAPLAGRGLSLSYAGCGLAVVIVAVSWAWVSIGPLDRRPSLLWVIWFVLLTLMVVVLTPELGRA